LYAFVAAQTDFAPYCTGKGRPDTAAARASIGAALLSASMEAAAAEGEGAAAVVPLEFAANVRSRIQQRLRHRDRTLSAIDKVFRGVRELTKEEIAELDRQSRRSRRRQEREERARSRQSGTASSVTLGSFSATSTASSPGQTRDTSSPAFPSAAVGTSPFTYHFGGVDELFSFGEPVSPSAAPAHGLSLAITDGGVAAEPALTVKVDPRWKLVYVGNDTEYSCTGLVPEDALEREPDLRVSVSFCYQVKECPRVCSVRNPSADTA
jgi:hypothetical protein